MVFAFKSNSGQTSILVYFSFVATRLINAKKVSKTYSFEREIEDIYYKIKCVDSQSGKKQKFG